MYLSDREKEIIELISQGKITDLASFAFERLPFKCETGPPGIFTGYGIYISPATNIYIIESDELHCAELVRFITLCKKLEKYELLYIPEKSTHKTLHPWFIKNPSDTEPSFAPKTCTLFEKYSEFEVVKSLELDSFVKHDFQTIQELTLMEERAARTSAQRITIIVSLASVIISTLTSLCVAYFNYKTYNKERFVTITNLAPTTKPIEVHIINDSEHQKTINTFSPATNAQKSLAKPQIVPKPK